MAGKPKKESTTKKSTSKVTKVEVEEKAPKTFRELRSELNGLKFKLEVEIMNLDTGTVIYRDRDDRKVFEMNKVGQRTFVVLADLYDIANRHIGYFENHVIRIVDVESNEYTVDDLLEYLNIKYIYEDLEDFDVNYIDHMLLRLSNNRFEQVISTANDQLVSGLAARARQLYKEGKFDSRYKEKLLAEKLNLDELLED